MMKALYIFCLLFVCMPVNSQVLTATQFRQELAPLQREITRTNASIDYRRVLLIAGSDTTIEKGTLLRGEGVNYRLVQNGVAIVQNSRGKLIVDSAQRTVALTIVDSLFSLMNGPDLTDDKVGNIYVLSKSAGKNVNTYYLTPKMEGLERAEIKIPVKGFFPTVMIVTYPPGNYISNSLDDQTIEEPVLTITYTAVKAAKPGKNDFSFDKYLVFENGKYKLTGFPDDYVFYDLRPDSIK